MNYAVNVLSYEERKRLTDIVRYEIDTLPVSDDSTLEDRIMFNADYMLSLSIWCDRGDSKHKGAATISPARILNEAEQLLRLHNRAVPSQLHILIAAYPTNIKVFGYAG